MRRRMWAYTSILSVLILNACEDVDAFIVRDAGLLLRESSAIWADYIPNGPETDLTPEEQSTVEIEIDNAYSKGNHHFCNLLPQVNETSSEDAPCYIRQERNSPTNIIPRQLYFTMTNGSRQPLKPFHGVADQDIVQWLFYHDQNQNTSSHAFANFMLVKTIEYCGESNTNAAGKVYKKFNGCTIQEAGGSIIADASLVKRNPIAHETGHILLNPQEIPSDLRRGIHLYCGKSGALGNGEITITQSTYLDDCGRDDNNPVDYKIPPYICNLILDPPSSAIEAFNQAGGQIIPIHSNEKSLCELYEHASK